MDISHVGADLFGDTESKVLAALARLAEPVSGRHLAKLAGADSHSTVQRYLHRLRKIGLVTATTTTSATHYQLNRDHVFWGPIEAVLAAPARIEREAADLVARELGASARVAVFGSVATGSSGPESDYDLLLVVAESVSSEDRARVAIKLSDLVERLTGNAGHVIDVSESELQNLVAHESPLVAEWKTHALPIDGRGRITQLQGVA